MHVFLLKSFLFDKYTQSDWNNNNEIFFNNNYSRIYLHISISKVNLCCKSVSKYSAQTPKNQQHYNIGSEQFSQSPAAVIIDL